MLRNEKELHVLKEDDTLSNPKSKGKEGKNTPNTELSRWEG